MMIEIAIKCISVGADALVQNFMNSSKLEWLCIHDVPLEMAEGLLISNCANRNRLKGIVH